MLLPKFDSHPAAMKRFAMMLLAIGLMIGVLGASWQRLSLHAFLSPNLNNFLQGSLIGLGIGLEIASILIAKKASCLKPHTS